MSLLSTDLSSHIQVTLSASLLSLGFQVNSWGTAVKYVDGYKLSIQFDPHTDSVEECASVQVEATGPRTGSRDIILCQRVMGIKGIKHALWVWLED